MFSTLFLDHLCSILEDIDDLKPDYEQLGLYLGIRESDMRTIKLPNPLNAWLCLKCVISEWLNRNTTTTQIPNRRILVDAIKRINYNLADRLERKYAKGSLISKEIGYTKIAKLTLTY